MKIEIFESNKKKDGVPVSVMVKAGAGVPDALQSKGVTWTLRTVLDCANRSRPWAPWVEDAIEAIKRDGYAVRAFGVVTEVVASPPPEVTARFDERWHRP